MKVMGILFLLAVLFVGLPTGFYELTNDTSWWNARQKTIVINRVLSGHEAEGDAMFLGNIFPVVQQLMKSKAKPKADSCDREEAAVLKRYIYAMVHGKGEYLTLPKCLAEREERRRLDAIQREEQRKKAALEKENKRQNRAWRQHYISRAEEEGQRQALVDRVAANTATADEITAVTGVYQDILQLARLRGRTCLSDCGRRLLEIEKIRVEHFVSTGKTDFTLLAEHTVEGSDGLTHVVDLSALPQCGPEEDCRANSSQ